MAHRKKHLKRKHSSKKHHKRSNKMTLDKKVMKIVRKNEQVKYAVYQSNFNFGNYASTTPNINQLQITPNTVTLLINQGTGAGDRLGDTIKIKKVTLRAVIVPNEYNITTNNLPEPQEVRVWVARNKTSAQALLPVSTMFEYGDTNVSPLGTLADMMTPINKESWTVYKDKVFKVGKEQQGTTPAALAYFNNDFKYNVKFKWDITKSCPSIIRYNTSNATSITSPISYLACMSASAANTSVATQSATCNIWYTVEVQFTDF
nr:MAG: capsid protein [Cressdnaviricota sp.]